jgi:hypothetical protein
MEVVVDLGGVVITLVILRRRTDINDVAEQAKHCHVPRLQNAGPPTLLGREAVRPDLTIRGKALLDQRYETRVVLCGEGTVELFMRLREFEVHHHSRSLGGGVEKTKIVRDVAKIFSKRETAVGARPEV